jgi:ATP-dependent RNA helicase RhlB
VQNVINYDLPQVSEDYVNRIGRTARAGAAGDAISFGCETYAISLPDIEDYIGHKIPVATFDASILPKLERPVQREKRPRSGGPSRSPRSGDRSQRSRSRRSK